MERQRFFVGRNVRIHLFELLVDRRFALDESRDLAGCALVFFTERLYSRFRFLFRLFAFGDGVFEFFDIFLFASDIFFTFLNLSLVGK